MRFLERFWGALQSEKGSSLIFIGFGSVGRSVQSGKTIRTSLSQRGAKVILDLEESTTCIQSVCLGQDFGPSVDLIT